MGCRGDSRGLRELGGQARGGAGTPRLRLGGGVGRPPRCWAGGPRSPRGALQPLLGMKGRASGSGSGQGAGGSRCRGDGGRLCLPVSLRAGRHPLSRHSVSVGLVRTREKERRVPALKGCPAPAAGLPHLSPTKIPPRLTMGATLDRWGVPQTPVRGAFCPLPAIPASHRPGPEATAGEAPVLGSVSLLQSLHTARGLKVAGNQVPSRKEALAALPTAAPRHSDSEGLRLSQGHAHWPVPTQQSNLRKAAGLGSLSARRKPDLGAPSTCHQHPLCQTRRPPAAPAPTLVSWQSRSERTQAVRGARGRRMG